MGNTIEIQMPETSFIDSTETFSVSGFEIPLDEFLFVNTKRSPNSN
jgi:hypothetical protein